VGELQRLTVCVGGNEVDAFHAGGDHAIDGVATAPATPMTLIFAPWRISS